MGLGEVERIFVYAMCIKNYGIVQVSMLSFLRELGPWIRWLAETEMSLLKSSTTPSSSSVAAESPCAYDRGSPHMKPPHSCSCPPPESVWIASPIYLLASQLLAIGKQKRFVSKHHLVILVHKKTWKWDKKVEQLRTPEQEITEATYLKHLNFCF